MIRPPRRSVTRFFIPMIDVLTLLFCMFLLLPIFRENETLMQQEETAGKERSLDLDQEMERRQKELDKLDRQLADLKQMTREVLQKNLQVRLIYLTVDKSGASRLSYPDLKNPGQPPIPLATERDAHDLIEKDRLEAGGKQLLYYFALRPDQPPDPRLKAIPTGEELDMYLNRWFSDVHCDGLVRPPPAGTKGKQP
jgi:hypothetical protein